MVERNVGLQSAIDIVTDMVRERVTEYAALKKCLPSFGADVDAELNRYIKALEHFVQGTVCWYYSPRTCLTCKFNSSFSEFCYRSGGYFRDLDLSDRQNLLVPVFTNSC